jgi:glycosyltransferase involved in cell wall biosynthesis
MKIACISTSQVPSSTANSIQLMKVCHALAACTATASHPDPVGQSHLPLTPGSATAGDQRQVRLWIPGLAATAWEKLADHYGLTQPFELRWLPSRPVFRRYDFTVRAVRQARAWGADLIYTWLLPVAALALQARLPVVLELHDLPTGLLGPRLFRYFAAHPGKKRLLVITQALASRLGVSSGRPLDVQVAPNGVDLEGYAGLPDAAEARRQLGMAENLTAVYTGHLYAGRGIDLLAGLAGGLPSVNFLWVGGRPEEVAAWKEKLAGLGIRNVFLTGFIENRRLPLYQAAGDVLLMPYERAIAGSSGGNSAEICSPMKMFDYLACGRAILTSDLPVFHEVLNDANACFCPPEDLPAWIKALAGLLQDAPRRQWLADQARRDSARYSWQARAFRALEGFAGG